MREEKLLSMSKLELWLAVIISVVTIATAYNVVATIPYRQAEMEKKIAILQAQIDNMQKDYQSQRELLVRIDERLKILQTTVDKKIP